MKTTGRLGAGRRILPSLDDLLAPEFQFSPANYAAPAECPLLDTTLLSTFADSRSGYPSADIGNRDLYSEEGEDLGEWDAGYLDSDHIPGYRSFGSGSESSIPASYYEADAFDWGVHIRDMQVRLHSSSLLHSVPLPFHLLPLRTVLQPAWPHDESSPEVSFHLRPAGRRS